MTHALPLGYVWAGGSLGSPSSFAVANALMLCLGAVALTLQRLVFRQPNVEPFGLHFRPNRWFLFGWLFPPLVMVTALAFSLLLPGAVFAPDMAGLPVEMSSFKQQVVAIGIPPLAGVLLIGLALGPTLNAVGALGEEIGWRGFLFKELAPLGFWRCSLLTGGLWALWHVPLFFEGYGDRQHPIAGGLGMIAFAIVLAPILQLVRAIRVRGGVRNFARHDGQHASYHRGIRSRRWRVDERWHSGRPSRDERHLVRWSQTARHGRYTRYDRLVHEPLTRSDAFRSLRRRYPSMHDAEVRHQKPRPWVEGSELLMIPMSREFQPARPQKGRHLVRLGTDAEEEGLAPRCRELRLSHGTFEALWVRDAFDVHVVEHDTGPSGSARDERKHAIDGVRSQVHGDPLPQEQGSQAAVEVCLFQRGTQRIAAEVDGNVPHVVGRAAEHSSHAALLPGARCGVVHLEDGDAPEFRPESIGTRITSRAEDDELRRPVADGRQQHVVEDSSADLMQNVCAGNALFQLTSSEPTECRPQPHPPSKPRHEVIRQMIWVSQTRVASQGSECAAKGGSFCRRAPVTG